ncbi:endonuclease/exonuclease/phosphatase family protein [Nioella aestuarii]|uniref:endonuclease/exonuclease/phosphatase family protein n=1 Tax=Nioella aestuarii TaxID=1662864 RepID=UPI003D7F5364
MRILSFNIQNLRLRRTGGTPRLDGARDRDEIGEAAELDAADRRLSAALLAEANADLILLQEVFDEETLEWFNTHHLPAAGLSPYPYAHCPPGNDGRGLDLAVLSRAPVQLTSHADLTAAELGLDAPRVDVPIFRRDCLMLEVGDLTVFTCHFKAPYPDAEAARPVRRREAEATRRIIGRYFKDPSSALWLIAGDLNEPFEAKTDPAIQPLLPPFSIDLMARLPEDQRWTYFDSHSGSYGQPDALLASPALAARWPDAVPRVLRAGLAYEATRHRGGHLQGVGRHRPHASDHAAVLLALPGI